MHSKNAQLRVLTITSSLNDEIADFEVCHFSISDTCTHLYMYTYYIHICVRAREMSWTAKRFRVDGTHNKIALYRLHYEGASIVPFRCISCHETKHDKERNT